MGANMPTSLATFALGLAAAHIVERGLRWWRGRAEMRLRRAAEDLLRQRGLRIGLYLSTVGVEDGDLRRALDLAAPPGRLVIGDGDVVVGGWAAPESPPQGRRLRLIVNDGASPSA